MNIPGRHKDRNLDTLIPEIFRFYRPFNHDYLPIGRTGNDIFPTVQCPVRCPEKPGDHDEKPQPHGIQDDVKPRLLGENMVKGKQHNCYE
jgi:hypothetical protein